MLSDFSVFPAASSSCDRGLNAGSCLSSCFCYMSLRVCVPDVPLYVKLALSRGSVRIGVRLIGAIRHRLATSSGRFHSSHLAPRGFDSFGLIGDCLSSSSILWVKRVRTDAQSVQDRRLDEAAASVPNLALLKSVSCSADCSL